MTAVVLRGDARRLPLPDASVGFWARVDRSGECWTWLRSVNSKGYGTLRWNGQPAGAHRVAYELVKGPIPARMVIDHLCRNRRCVNPDHLEAVTCGENLRRGQIRQNNGNLAKVRCPAGHPYDPVNTYLDPSGRRQCKTCRRAEVRRRRSSYVEGR
jgi:hypothetical protein